MIEHFTHEFFIRGREDLLANIHRKTSSNFTKSSSKVSTSRGLGKVGFGAGPSSKEVHTATCTLPLNVFLTRFSLSFSLSFSPSPPLPHPRVTCPVPMVVALIGVCNSMCCPIHAL